MIIESCKWVLFPSGLVSHALILNEVYEVNAYFYWQEIQFKFYCQLKPVDTGYILELSPVHEIEYPCPHFPITLLICLERTGRFKSSGSYTIILNSQNEVEADEHDANPFCVILR